MHSKIDNTVLELILEKDKVYPVMVRSTVMLLSCIFDK